LTDRWAKVRKPFLSGKSMNTPARDVPEMYGHTPAHGAVGCGSKVNVEK